MGNGKKEQFGTLGKMETENGKMENLGKMKNGKWEIGEKKVI